MAVKSLLLLGMVLASLLLVSQDEADARELTEANESEGKNVKHAGADLKDDYPRGYGAAYPGNGDGYGAGYNGGPGYSGEYVGPPGYGGGNNGGG